MVGFTRRPLFDSKSRSISGTPEMIMEKRLLKFRLPHEILSKVDEGKTCYLVLDSVLAKQKQEMFSIHRMWSSQSF